MINVTHTVKHILLQYLIHKKLHCNLNFLNQEQHIVFSQFIAYPAKILVNEKKLLITVSLYIRVI